MKAQNLNNSSVKTRKLIRATFAEMLSEKREISKISVTELTRRADINRGTFYSHYDDIYSVAEDYENDLIEKFFDNSRLLASSNFEKFINSFFSYIKENDENYKMLCRSDEMLFAVKRLALLSSNKCLELCLNDRRLKNRDFLELDITIFIEGLLMEYVKYCRGQSAVTPDQLKEYTLSWFKKFSEYRFGNREESRLSQFTRG